MDNHVVAKLILLLDICWDKILFPRRISTANFIQQLQHQNYLNKIKTPVTTNSHGCFLQKAEKVIIILLLLFWL